MKKFIVSAAATLLALPLAACGSDGGDTASSDGPIKLFQLTEVQSASVSLPFTKSSAQAAVDQINAAGGINGRMLELDTCNEAGDPNTGIKCVQRAAKGDYVAMVGGFSLFGSQVNPIIDESGLANIGLDAVTPSDGQAKSAFPFDLGVPGYAAMPPVAAEKLGASKVAAFYVESPAAESIKQYFKVGADAAGVEIVKEILIPVDATDYTQYIAQAEDAGAEVIISGMSVNNNLAIWKAIESSGSSLKTVMSDGGVSQSLIDEAGKAATEGNYVVNGIPSTEDSTEAGKAYRAAMAEFAPDEKVLAGVGMRAWLSVELFRQVAETIDGDITRESVTEAFNNLDELEFFWIDSLSFVEDGPIKDFPRIVSTQSFPSKITNGTYSPEPPINPFGS